MSYDEGLAQILRDALNGEDGVSERKMFGGLAFLLHGHMVCGVHQGGTMFRVGKEREAAARALEGTGPMLFTGRPMGGMVDVSDEAVADEARLNLLLSLALENARSLPPKT